MLLHTQKTGVPVYCVLPDVVIAALDAAPRSSERYFFWDGRINGPQCEGKMAAQITTPL